ncbi:MAG: hypothetical protein NTV24_01330, partial [Candidatus Woesebacteria bacterium]|nr:hypothetical protein [Candidatus Woesebacteria bacterium]
MFNKKRRFNKRAFRLRLKKQTVFSIAQIFFLVLAGLIVLSFLRKGLILIKINDVLITYFSWTVVFLPFIFLSFSFFVSKLKGPLSQPNVLVGILLFFVSIASLTRAGILGGNAWDGISGLITNMGAFIIFLGTSLIGLIILFNTSFEQVIGEATLITNRLKKFIFSDKSTQGKLWKKPMRVSGEVLLKHQEVKTEPGILAPKLVTNVPGQDKVWKYPPLDLLSVTETGKADRGDIKGNAAIIEKTL